MALLSWVLFGVLALAAASAGWDLGKTWQRTGKWSGDLIKAVLVLSIAAVIFGVIAISDKPAGPRSVAASAPYEKWAKSVRDYWNQNGSGTVTEIRFAGQAPTSLWVEVSGYNAMQAQRLAELIAANFAQQFPEEQMAVHVYSPYPNEIAKAWAK